MKILALDVATVTGWAVYNTDQKPSAIVSGSFRTGSEGDTLCDKLMEIRRQVPKLIRQHQPDFVAIEEPLMIAPRYKAKPKKGLLSDGASTPSVDKDVVVSLLWKGKNIHEIASALRCKLDAVVGALNEGGMSPKTTVILSELAGGATVAVQGFNIPCVQVAAQRWQSIIPADIKSMFSGEGATKKRAKAYCEILRIVSPNMDSRDACIIAIWAAGHCQEVKFMARAA